MTDQKRYHQQQLEGYWQPSIHIGKDRVKGISASMHALNRCSVASVSSEQEFRGSLYYISPLKR